MPTKIISLPRLALAASLAGVVLTLSGCVTAKPSAAPAMTATPAATVTKHAASVIVTVTGGSDTSKLGASKISNADFAEAIKTSITQSGLFAGLAGESQADYRLEAQIVRLEQPVFGLSFTVNLETNWHLTRRSDSKVIWEKAITSSFTATTKDAFAGVTRLRLANEGAARNNIQDALTQIGALTLP